MTPDLKTLRSVAEGLRAARLVMLKNVSDPTARSLFAAAENQWHTTADEQAILFLLDRVETLEGALAAVHGHVQDQSGSRTFDDCSTALMWIDDLCRALNPSTGVEGGGS